jgi:glycosyltransferase involved in cell wall biosynthesis
MTRLVSIVLPTYNGARHPDWLDASIRSCLDQTYRHLELIIVDDCSTDDTPRLLAQYAGDPRVRIIRHETNQKLPRALNTGFAHARGDYLTWTSDDNVFTPDAIERMVAYLESQPGVGFVYTDYVLIDDAGRTIRRVEAGGPEHLRERCAIACFLYRRAVYETVGDYDPSLFRIEDYDYWLRVAQRFPLGWLPEPLYLYRRHLGSLTGTDHLENRARMFDEVNSRFYGPDPQRRIRTLSQFYVAEAFERHEQGHRSGVLMFAWRALRHDLTLLQNRGAWSIVAQAIVGAWFYALIKSLRNLWLMLHLLPLLHLDSTWHLHVLICPGKLGL